MKVFLIVIDTLRADHLSCYGYFRKTSPTIDRLAEEGVLFRDMHATAVATGPGFTTIVSGLAPISQGFYSTPYNVANVQNFDDEVPTLAELVWARGGYLTAAFDNLMNFRSSMKQMARGVNYYVNVDSRAPEKGRGASMLVGERVNQALIPWIKAHAKEDFFCFVHYWDPHLPYNQPPEYRECFTHAQGDLSDLEVCEARAGYRYVPGWGVTDEIDKFSSGNAGLNIDLYDGEIVYVDGLVGEIVRTLKRLKIERDAAIIVTSDHGEQLGQHGMWGHAGLHEAVVFVPLIMWAPGRLPAGTIINGYAQQADIAPTVLDLIGATNMPDFDGQSLLPIIRQSRRARRTIFMEEARQRAVLRGNWKYIRSYMPKREALYNIKDDPCEIVNLAREEPKRLESLRAELDRWVAKKLDDRPDPLLRTLRRWRSCWREQLGRELPPAPI